MTEDEIREFLLAWLMAFGTEPVGGRRHSDEWYGLQVKHGGSVKYSGLRPYMDRMQPDTYQINQAGLDFIKGE